MEWLAITKANHAFQSFTKAPAKLPDYGVPESVDLTNSIEFVRNKMEGIRMPEFVETVSPHDASVKARQLPPEKVERNPQTVQMLEMLELDFKLDTGGDHFGNKPYSSSSATRYRVPGAGPFTLPGTQGMPPMGTQYPPPPPPPPPPVVKDPDVIDLDDI
jgi:hypothetical protein